MSKGTKSLWRNVLSILSFKEFSNLKVRSVMQKKMQNKRMQTKATVNVKISLNFHC